MNNGKKAFTLAEGATHITMSKNVRKCAFTLAEVLITLGIIGVVAAITMPTLIQSHQKTVYATGIKKAINITSNMFTKMQADDEASNIANITLVSDGFCAVINGENGENANGCEDQYGNHSVFKDIIQKYLKVVKTCEGSDCDIEYQAKCTVGASNKLTCTNTGLSMADNDYFTWGQTVVGFYTVDGMIYYFVPSSEAIRVAVDTNGVKGPNQHGRDLFYYNYCFRSNGKFLPINLGGYDVCYGNTNPEASSPLYRLINNGWKMNY